MNRRNFLRRFGFGAAVVAIPIAVASAANDISKEKKDVLDKLHLSEDGSVFIDGGVKTGGDMVANSLKIEDKDTKEPILFAGKENSDKNPFKE